MLGDLIERHGGENGLEQALRADLVEADKDVQRERERVSRLRAKLRQAEEDEQDAEQSRDMLQHRLDELKAYQRAREQDTEAGRILTAATRAENLLAVPGVSRAAAAQMVGASSWKELEGWLSGLGEWRAGLLALEREKPRHYLTFTCELLKRSPDALRRLEAFGEGWRGEEATYAEPDDVEPERRWWVGVDTLIEINHVAGQSEVIEESP